MAGGAIAQTWTANSSSSSPATWPAGFRGSLTRPAGELLELASSDVAGGELLDLGDGRQRCRRASRPGRRPAALPAAPYTLPEIAGYFP